MGCLRDIKRLFHDRNPFYAGFGNRLTDGLSYRSVEIPSSRIFTIDSSGNVKLELLELAGYSSTYIAMTNLVNETFPSVHRSNQPAYNDFNYWRVSLPELDLPADLLSPPFNPPVSPALSARSDSSNATATRMSVFRIASTLAKRASTSNFKGGDEAGNTNRSSDRFPAPPISPRSSSPTPLRAIYSSDDEEEYNEDEEETDGERLQNRRKAARK